MPAVYEASRMDRKVKKPLMEKKRRARINTCLGDLKNLLLESLKRDPAQTSKLEKADILEMTVHLLRTLQKQQLALAAGLDPSIMERFQNGWAECKAQVTHYANSVDGFNPKVRQRLLDHLELRFWEIQKTKEAIQSPGSFQPRPPVPPVQTRMPFAFIPQPNPWKFPQRFPPGIPGMPVLVSALQQAGHHHQIKKQSPDLVSESSGEMERFEEDGDDSDHSELLSGKEASSTPVSATLPSTSLWRPW